MGQGRKVRAEPGRAAVGRQPVECGERAPRAAPGRLTRPATRRNPNRTRSRLGPSSVQSRLLCNTSTGSTCTAWRWRLAPVARVDKTPWSWLLSSAAKTRGFVAFHPGAYVNQQRKTCRVALGKAVLAKALNLLKNLLSKGCVIPAGHHAADDACIKRCRRGGYAAMARRRLSASSASNRGNMALASLALETRARKVRSGACCRPGPGTCTGSSPRRRKYGCTMPP